MNTSSTNEAKGFYKLSWLQRIGFGSGDLAQNFIFQTVMQWFSIFYLTVFGFDPTKVAIMVFIPPVLNIFLSMWLGAFVDKHNPKLGKYRSYLVFGGIPLTVFAILCFWTGFPGNKMVYAFVTYTVLYLLYTTVSLPYGALFASLTRDTNEMNKLTSVRMILANLGGLSVAFLIPTIVQWLSPDGKFNTPASADAWLITMTIFAIVGFALLVFCFSQSKERVVMAADQTDKVKASDMWRELKRNRPLRVVAFFIFMAFAMMSIYNAAGAYFMTYNINVQEYTSWFQGIGFIPAFIFLPMLPAIIKAIGKKQMFYLFLLIAIIGMALLYIVAVTPLHTQIWAVLLAQFVKATGILVATGYMWALVPEVISYGEHTTGKRLSGTINAITGIVFQLGLAVGLFIPNMVLGLVGFDKDATQQTALAEQGILWLVAVVPIILLVLMMFIISKYELTDKVIKKINQDIENKHKNEQ